MNELQATLEFSVELNKFYNVDLFQRGYYQIRVSLKTPPKSPAKIEVSLPRNSETPYIVPACIIHGVAASKTFQILYRNEEISINDTVLYRLHTLAENEKVEDTLEKMEFQLGIELWFGDEEHGPQVQEKLECVSQRVLLLHFSPTKGLHHHVPVIFDYFHLCCMEVTVHATLIALHQPYISMPNRRPSSGWAGRGQDQSTLENIYFGNRPLSGTASKFFLKSRLQDACQVHRKICKILLSAYESLQSNFELYLSKMSPPPSVKFEHVDCHKRLELILEVLQGFEEEDDLLQTATTDVTQLCAENVILWTQFLDAVTIQETVLQHLAQEHHNLRVKRLAEAFFTFEYPKQESIACYEPSIHGHSDIATVVRNSPYYQTLPPLPAELLEVDGDANSLPIIFEDVYTDHFDSPAPVTCVKKKAQKESSSDSVNYLTPKMPRSDSSSSHSGDSPSLRSKGKKKFIKNIKPEAFKRPSSTYNINAAEMSPAARKDVVLVGYRKVPAAESVPRVEPVELGTFNPNMASILDELDLSGGGLGSSSSMPSLLVRSCWSRASSNSMPEMDPETSPNMSNRGQKDCSPARSNSSPRRSSGSKIVLRRQQDDALKGSPLSGVKKVGNPDYRHTMYEPITQNLYSQHFKEGGVQGSGSDPGTPEPLRTSKDDTSGISSADSGEASDSVSHDISAMHIEQKDYDNLAKGISQALGEAEEDSNCNMSNSTSSSDSSIVLDKLINGEVLDDSCMNLDKDSGISDSVNRSGGNLSEAGLGQSEMIDSSVLSEMKTGASVVSHSVSDSSLSQPAATVAPGDRKMGTEDSSGSEEKLTLIELLKEEYAKLQQEGSLSDSATDEVCINRRQNSLKGSHKCSSDTDICERAAHLAKPVAQETYDVSCSEAGTQSAAGSGGLTASSNSNLVAQRSSAMSMSISSSTPELSQYNDKSERPRLVNLVGNQTISFVTMKEKLKSQLRFQGQLYSDFSTLASQNPYFIIPSDVEEGPEGLHLVICVHGLDGNSADLRLIKTYMEMSLPGYKLEFLMSERNQDTFSDFDTMTDRLVKEILAHIEMFSLRPTRISFVGHSLGNIIIRSALSRPELAPFITKLYTFLSLSGPHLGTLYNNSGLVNMGMWFMQKWKKSGSLLQLSLKDHPDPRQTFLYKLSMKPGLELFRYVLLVGSAQDRYVPFHSSRIEVCRPAHRDNSTFGAVYCEMVENIMRPIIHNSGTTLIRYDVFHALPSTANTIIGRAAHIAVLDSELFIEKFLMVAGLKYFR